MTVADPSSNRPPAAARSLKSRWRLIVSWAVFAAILVGGVVWLKQDDKRVKPGIPPSINDSTITFSNRPDGIRTEPVDGASLIESGFPGRLTWAEDRTSRVRSPFTGRVVRALVKVGDQVAAGQPLAEIHSGEYGRAEADYQLAESSLERARLLYQAGILSKRELQTTEAEHKRARAEFLRSQPVGSGALDGSRDGLFLLRSPISGVVVELAINPGQEIRAEQDAPPLFLITDPAQLWVWVDLSEIDIRQLQPVRVPFNVTINSLAFADRSFSGSIVQFSEFLDPVTRTFRLRGVVNNASRQLKGEMFVNVSLPIGIEGDAGDRQFSIPSSALFLVGEKRYVFVQTTETSYSRQEVQVYREIAGRSIVRGLSMNQRVVTDGNLYLQQILTRSTKATPDGAETPAKEGGKS